MQKKFNNYVKTILFPSIQPRKKSFLWSFACPFHTWRNLYFYLTVKKYTYSQKIVFLIKSESLLHHAKNISRASSALRKCFSDQFGDAGGLNPFPISGGICEHWPDWAKNEVIDSVQEYQSTLDDSLKLWIDCGRRSYTWRKLKDSILL